jgi:hypothetical protein
MKQQESTRSNDDDALEWESPVLEEIDVASITERNFGPNVDATTLFGS